MVTPATRPEVLLALQHQHATVALHNECADIRQLIGGIQSDISALRGDIINVKTDVSDLSGHISELRHLRSKIVGGALVLGLLISTVIGLFWYFVGPTWVTLESIATEYRVHKADADAANNGADELANKTKS